jgi:hypothetical protein
MGEKGVTRSSGFEVPDTLEPSSVPPVSLVAPATLAMTDRRMLNSFSSMAPAPQHQARRQLSYKPCFLLILLCVAGTACSTTTLTGKILFDDPRGTVSLQTMSDQSIQATHPVSLEPILLAQVLSGIEVQHQERGIQSLITGSVAPVFVFSDDQIQFLAPLLAEGLRTAAANERVAFRVLTTHEGSGLESSWTDTTSGYLYAYGRQLCMILTLYRYSPIQRNLVKASDMAYKSRDPDSSGLQDQILLFTPRAAQRSDRVDPPAMEKTTDRFLAVDYQLLQQKPPAPVTAEQTVPVGTTATSGASAQSTEDLAREVEALKKEMQSLKQQRLGNQPTSPDSPKQKTTPQQK